MVDTDKILHSAQLLVCVGGLATATSVLTGGGAIVAGVLSWREIRKHLPATAKSLVEEVAGALKKGFEAHRATHDQRIIIPNMIEASLPDPKTIMDSGMQAEHLVAAMVKTIKGNGEIEQNLDGNIALFKTLLVPIFADLLSNEEFAKTLAPAFQKAVLSDLRDIKETGERTEAKVDNVPQVVVDLLKQQGLMGQDGITLEDLVALAALFGAPDLKTRVELIGFLVNKAEEYISYKSLIDGLDERIPALANLKGAAQDAAARLNFDEVEELMARVDEVETEISADTKLVRAKNALLRGRVEDAYTHLCTAADSFANIDPVQAAKRRLDYSGLLHKHGEQYGGQGLELSIDMLSEALSVLSKEKNPVLWADGKLKLAVVFSVLGERTEGKAGDNLLKEAVASYMRALEIFTREGHPVSWAGTQQNLACVLQGLGKRTEGKEGYDLLVESVAIFQQVMQVFTRADYPEDWARAQMNLAVTFLVQVERADESKGDDLLAKSVVALRHALEIFTQKDYPLDWARAQLNRANVLRNQGDRADREVDNDLLEESIIALQKALKIFTQENYPLDWARAQLNRANVLRALGESTKGKEGAKLLAEAVAAYQQVLEVRTREEYPVDWAMTKENLAITELTRAMHGHCIDRRGHLQAALVHVTEALEVYDSDYMSHYYQKASRLRDDLGGRLMLLDAEE